MFSVCRVGSGMEGGRRGRRVHCGYLWAWSGGPGGKYGEAHTNFKTTLDKSMDACKEASD